jgi:hypothetical protein
LATKELVVASKQHTVSHFYFYQGFLPKNNMTASPTPPCSLDVVPLTLFSVFSIEGHHFDTTAVIQAARLQAGLNTITDHDFWDETWQN